MTTCSSMALRQILPMPHATGTVTGKHENMTSSTKPEVDNVLHCHHEDRATATGNMHRKPHEVCGHVFFAVPGWRDRQTERHRHNRHTQ